MRNDVIRMYRDIHSWVGIISGLALFIAFYAGALTMFEVPLQRWASPPAAAAAYTPFERSEELMARVFAQYPEAARNYQLTLQPSPEHPALLSWTVRTRDADEHLQSLTRYASLAEDGSLQITEQGPSQVAELVDILHQQVGLTFSHEVAMPIMGVIALLYCIALVSGVIVLLPTLVKDLFAYRPGKNLKRMWLDVHNLLGFFSLPFHIIMALTAVVFAFHDQFYETQDLLLNEGESIFIAPTEPVAVPTGNPLSPATLLQSLANQAPGFEPRYLQYSRDQEGVLSLRVAGVDARYGLRGPTEGYAGLDPYSGELVDTDYMPGHQGAWFAVISSFFALHFGNFGGAPIRWSYFLLGLAGAALFYTGNLLWLETHRKRQRKGYEQAAIQQTRSSHVLGALTVGVSLGCVAGISLTIAAAKLLPGVADPAHWHEVLYYVVFLGALAWALKRGVARAAYELLLAAAFTTAAIPAVSLLCMIVPGLGWNHGGASLAVDAVAVIGALALWYLARRTLRRITSAPEDSVWFVGTAQPQYGRALVEGSQVERA